MEDETTLIKSKYSCSYFFIADASKRLGHQHAAKEDNSDTTPKGKGSIIYTGTETQRERGTCRGQGERPAIAAVLAGSTPTAHT